MVINCPTFLILDVSGNAFETSNFITMKKQTIIIFLSVLLTSCSKSFIQIFDTATTNTQLKNEYFVYETDTMKITYSFWTSKGVMSFAVYNKLDKPIYIDWKNSSFIYNDNKLNYWIEQTQTNISSYYGGYFYNGPLLRPGFTINEGVQNSSSSTLKPEKVTFIPPKSNYYRSQFYLWPVDYYKVNLNCQTSVGPRNDKPKKKTTVYSEDFSFANSPLRFRNYLAFSFTENSQQFFFVDNEFYMTTVKEMDYRHYKGKLLGFDKKNLPIYEKSRFEKETSFFIKVPKYEGIE